MQDDKDRSRQAAIGIRASETIVLLFALVLGRFVHFACSASAPSSNFFGWSTVVFCVGLQEDVVTACVMHLLRPRALARMVTLLATVVTLCDALSFAILRVPLTLDGLAVVVQGAWVDAFRRLSTAAFSVKSPGMLSGSVLAVAFPFLCVALAYVPWVLRRLILSNGSVATSVPTVRWTFRKRIIVSTHPPPLLIIS
jgi:hypothetical protein